ncbi:MAG TPA: TonB family protein [Pyrinomonadaceae bacterium]|nr:TonB family protein [Pyrinomonadaceae bacterium]
MRKLITYLMVALLTFAIGAAASTLFDVTSPSAETAKRQTVELRASVGPAPSTSDMTKAPINGGILNGKAISLPQPTYPPIAKAAHATGTVTVQVTIDETGKVESARVVGGHPLLQSAALQAALEARFPPTRLSGQPVKVTGVLTYNFAL